MLSDGKFQGTSKPMVLYGSQWCDSSQAVLPGGSKSHVCSDLQAGSFHYIFFFAHFNGLCRTDIERFKLFLYHLLVFFFKSEQGFSDRVW